MRSLFTNLPVKDLNRTVKFFEGLGFGFNPEFTDETATCMVIAENAFIMFLTEEKFKTFTKKEIVDATKGIEALFGISAESREEVDRIFNKAVELGASEARSTEDHGWMYGRSFYDLDGHTWEIIYMDPKGPQ